MKCYFLAQIEISDPAEYQKYLDGFDAVFADYKGRVIAVDDDPVVLEGDWPYQRTVLMCFPDLSEARKWYDSPEYQQLVKNRHRASKANIVLVEGRE
ncbi:MAG: DUF1330 domain-containing protein [Candidatus Zixiibacteriota bacterium]|nr:MAG: DUF1330 domain-containing protein [candidate division Zixibacteria bacterium]